MKQQSVTLQDIFRAIIDLEQKIAAGQVSAIDAGESDLVLDEPADLAEALENLGL